MSSTRIAALSCLLALAGLTCPLRQAAGQAAPAPAVLAVPSPVPAVLPPASSAVPPSLPADLAPASGLLPQEPTGTADPDAPAGRPPALPRLTDLFDPLRPAAAPDVAVSESAPAASSPVGAKPGETRPVDSSAVPQPPVPPVPGMVRVPLAAAPPPPVEAPHLSVSSSPEIPHTPFGKMIYKTALRYALDPRVVAALIAVESDFKPYARSRKGARGLMQLIPSTARRFGLSRRRDLLNPAKNLDAGMRYLRWLVDHFGDDAMRVLAAYNAGEGAVERFGGLPPFQETRDYVQRIYSRLGYSLELSAIALAAPLAAASAPEELTR